MIELNTILLVIISFLPPLSAVIGIIASVVKMTKNNSEVIKPIIEQFDALRQEVKDKTEMTEAKEQIKNLLARIDKQDQIIADLITEISKVKYYGPKE